MDSGRKTLASKMHDNLVSGRIYSYVLVRTRILGLLKRRKVGVGWAWDGREVGVNQFS